MNYSLFSRVTIQLFVLAKKSFFSSLRGQFFSDELSHSSNENLTRDWVNTAALEAPVACHPCHRIHNAAAALCAKDTNTGAAACMASYGADLVADLVLRALGVATPEKATVIPIKAVA